MKILTFFTLLLIALAVSSSLLLVEATKNRINFLQNPHKNAKNNIQKLKNKQHSYEINRRRTPSTMTSTPPLGWNSWNLYAASTSAALLMQTADAMVASGLAAQGFVFVNSDDGWDLVARNATTHTQIPDPVKFPDGWQPVTDYIHSKGLMAGLYTAKGPRTCQGFAGSCDHEEIDAKYYASVGIDYVKDDSCSLCLFSDDNQDYRRMWLGLNQTGRPIFLSVEANPTDTLITRGGYCNSKRVGHDIKAWLDNMYTLVDIGSNLWPFAHNGSAVYSTTGQGFWNDLDMSEIGNGPDFLCNTSDAAAARCRVHYSYWTIMKAVILLGNDLMTMDPVSLSIVGNPIALSINQDPLGVQARRVYVQMPQNNSLVHEIRASSTPANFGVIRQCDESIPTQKWKFVPTKANQSITGMLQTVDADGNTLCLTRTNYPGGFFAATLDCDPSDSKAVFDIIKVLDKQKQNGKEQNENEGIFSPCTNSSQDACDFGVSWNSQKYASGPVPHTRYLQSGFDLFQEFNFDVANVFSTDPSNKGGWIRAADNSTIQNDNLVGKITTGGCFALDVVPLGVLEVWAGPLTNGRIAVLVSNRSPGADSVMVNWRDIGATSRTSAYTITDVWSGDELGYFEDAVMVGVNALDVGYFIFTPVS